MNNNLDSTDPRLTDTEYDKPDEESSTKNTRDAVADPPYKAARPQYLICSPGKNIIAQGTPADNAYVIVDGHADVIVDDGTEAIKIAEIGPGEIFGEMGVLEGAARMATIRATEQTKVLILSKEDITNMIEETKSPAAKALIGVLLKRLRKSNIDRLSYQKSMINLRRKTLGIAAKAEKGIDPQRKDEFSAKIEPLLNQIEDLLDQYKTPE